MKRFPVFLLCASAALAGDRTYQATDLTPLNMPPTFDNGYLIVRGRGAEFDVYGPNTALTYRIQRPAGWSMGNAAVDTDGSAAVSMEREYTAGAIALYGPTGSPLRTIETGAFRPGYVRFGPDHTIWAAGRGTLRRYSREGEQLGSYVLLPPDSNWQEPVVQLPALRVCPDRVGYLMEPGDGRLTWVETDLNGRELGRWPLPGREGRAPVFAGGRTYVSTSAGVLALDRASGKWEPAPVAHGGLIIGSDGPALVFLDRGSATLRWVAP